MRPRRSKLGIFVTAALTLTTLVGVQAPTRAAFPGANGRIFFYRQVGVDEATNEIFSMKANGTDKKRLTNNNTEDQDPQLSASGRWVVFERVVDGDTDIFKMKPGGTGVKRLTNNAVGTVDNKDPGWSPNGSRIVFSSNRDGDDSLYTMKADGSNESRLTVPAAADDDSNPRWSPNGNWIAFRREFDTGSITEAICRIRPNGDDEGCITDEDFETLDDPEWAPNSRKIVFEGLESGGSFTTENIFVMKPDGSNVVQLTTRSDLASDPAYSPDGKKIIFEVKENAPNRLMRMNANGSNQQGVTPATYDVQDADWGVKP